jgi:hypothetical protein
MTRDQCYDFKNIFAEKFSEKIGVFYSKQTQILKKLIITLVFKKNANFFAQNWEKSQKIVIITSAPDWANFCQLVFVHFGQLFKKLEKYPIIFGHLFPR